MPATAQCSSLPYSNRLRNSRLKHAGLVHALPAHPAAQPHTLHGVSHTLAWDVLEHSVTHALLAVDYNGEHWPWPVRFQQRFELDGDRVHLQLSVTNLGHTSMPAGLGLHPYFQRHPGMTVRFAPALAWDIDADYLPTGSVRELSEPLLLCADVGHEVAVYGSRWDGRLHLDYPEGQVLLTANQPLSHLVVFAPPGVPYLCLEPVSYLADAFNKPPAQWPEQGSLLDYGMFLQSVMLAARGRGLHTCPQAAFLKYHAVISETLNIPADQMLVCGMSLGYANPHAVENSLVTAREAVSAFTVFHHDG